MSDPTRDDLARRLRAAVEHHVPAEVRAEHLRAIAAAASVAGAPAASPVAPWRARLQRTLAAGSALAAVAMPGAAIAAQDAMPGDALYGVKRASEAVIALVDDDVRIDHRADELAALLDAGRDEDLTDVLADAEALLRSVPADDRAVARLEALVLQAQQRLHGPAPASARPADAGDDAPAGPGRPSSSERGEAPAGRGPEDRPGRSGGADAGADARDDASEAPVRDDAQAEDEPAGEPTETEEGDERDDAPGNAGGAGAGDPPAPAGPPADGAADDASDDDDAGDDADDTAGSDEQEPGSEDADTTDARLRIAERLGNERSVAPMGPLAAKLR